MAEKDFVLVTKREPSAPASSLFDQDEDGPALVIKAAAARDELLARPAVQSAAAAQATSVQVVCRTRPLLEHEHERVGARIEGSSAASHAQFDYEAVVAHGAQVLCLSEERKIGVPTGEMAVTPYTLHGAYAAASGSEEVYTQSIAPLVRLAAAGGLGTVIAYGQTGSGKTFTIRALQRLAAAELLAADGGGGGLWVSFFENMGDKCFDLLNGRAPLVLRDDGKGEMSVVGLAERSVGSADEFDELLAAGNALRATKATQSNDQSSRSHALCTLRLGGPAGGKLQLVDLAGSERREDVVEHDAARIGEMQQINSSLGTLKECIRANLRRATDEPNAHIPYRNSKLTMLLRAAFEHSRVGAGDGDGASAAPRSAVCFAAHVSPLRSQAKHTANTLEYAAQMLQATMAERQRAEFDEVEKWSSKKVVGWVAQLDEGKFAHCSHAFARCTGKMLTVEFLPDVAQWLEAAGGTAEDAERIFYAFRELHKKAKAAKNKATAGPGAVARPAFRPPALVPR